MSNLKTTDDIRCELHQFERNRYFYGKLMTVRDFKGEQNYLRENRYLHNQSLHGCGVVCGLEVTSPGGTKVKVTPGIALDCCGREIILAKEQDGEVDLTDFISTVEATGKTVFLCIRYDDCVREPVPAQSKVSTCEEVCDYSRIQERFAFDILDKLPEPTPSEVCETWMNLTTVKSDIKEGVTTIAEFERLALRWIRKGDAFEVRRRINPLASGKTIRVADTLPDGFNLLDGSLEMEAINTIEGKVVHSTYLVEAVGEVGEYKITGQILQSPPADLPSSTIKIITDRLEVQFRRELFQQQFAKCPPPADDLNSRCVILARITLQPKGSSFIVHSVDDLVLDSEKGIYRQLVYHTPLVVELLNCLREGLRLSDGRPFRPHAVTHQDGGSDEINVTNLSGMLAKPQKVEVQDENGPVFVRKRLNFVGPGVTATDDTANNRVNIRILGSNVPTGRVVFKNMKPGEIRESTFIEHGLSVDHKAIVLALEMQFRDTPYVYMGEYRFINSEYFPYAMASAYSPKEKWFVIGLHDLRKDGKAQDVSVRWWVIPKTVDRPTVTIPPKAGVAAVTADYLVARLLMRPGMKIEELASDLGVQPREMKPKLDRFCREGLIHVKEGRYFLGSEAAPPPPVPEHRERIIEFVRSNPGITITRLAEASGIDRATLTPVLGRLVEEGVIRRDSRGRYTISES